MITIHKFRIPIIGRFTLELPIEARVLSVQIQNTEPHVWVLLDTEQETKKKEFFIFGTGHSLLEGMDKKGTIDHIGTFQKDCCVWHLFEFISKEDEENEIIEEK